MKLINIDDLTKIIQQINQEAANSEEFLGKICPGEKEKFIEKEKGNYYLISDQLANTILARCLIIQNRLYEGKDEEYEKHLENLAQKRLKCYLMNPKNPEASLYEGRKERVNKVIKGDYGL